MLSDSMALAIRRRMKRFMGMASCVEWISDLGVAPDDVPDGDLLRDQTELEEAVGDGLLGFDDPLRYRTDRERGAVGRDGLDFQRHAGHRGKRSCDCVAMRFRPPCGFRQTR